MAVVLGVGILSGCADQMEDWRRMAAHRDGPQPLPTVVAVQQEAARQGAIMDTIRDETARAFERSPRPYTWYDVTQTGFNLVDTSCVSYIDDLYKFDRRKDRLRDLLNFAGTTTTTVASLAGAPATSLGYLAQAFGFAAGATLVFGDSYLYRARPATIAKIVYDLKLKFRQNAALNKASIDSQAMSYIYIQNYLNQCLPVTIEQYIDSYLAASKPDPATVPVGTPASNAAPARMTLVTPN
ncbi:MAG TPA: hypothetical protein VLA00_02445 [Xanthobacteraceae bacterium]|nr:hypothetical protein [Xanthobacteraceae bacterium]